MAQAIERGGVARFRGGTSPSGIRYDYARQIVGTRLSASPMARGLLAMAVASGAILLARDPLPALSAAIVDQQTAAISRIDPILEPGPGGSFQRTSTRTDLSDDELSQHLSDLGKQGLPRFMSDPVVQGLVDFAGRNDNIRVWLLPRDALSKVPLLPGARPDALGGGAFSFRLVSSNNTRHCVVAVPVIEALLQAHPDSQSLQRVGALLASHEIAHCLSSPLADPQLAALSKVALSDNLPEKAAAQVYLRYAGEAVADAFAMATIMVSRVNQEFTKYELSEGQRLQDEAIIEARVRSIVESDSLPLRMAMMRSAGGGANPIHDTSALLLQMREHFWTDQLIRVFVKNAGHSSEERAKLAIQEMARHLSYTHLRESFDLLPQDELYARTTGAALDMPAPLTKAILTAARGAAFAQMAAAPAPLDPSAAQTVQELAAREDLNQP